MSNLAIKAHSELSWYLPGKVMCLRISGDYALEDSTRINAAIIEELEQSPNDLSLLIDATEMTRPYHFSQLRTTQNYKDHHRLQHLYIVTGDRLVKLALMIIFNVSRAQLILCDGIAAAHKRINLHFGQ